MSCLSCNSKFEKNLINFGTNAKSSEFVRNTRELKKIKKYKTVVGVCKKCKLIQLKQPINFQEIVPSKRWIINKEEDKHHKNFVNILKHRKIFKKDSKILIISNYDEFFQKNLRLQGFKKVFKLNIKNHFNIIDKNFFRQEVIQHHLNFINSIKLVNKLGKFDVIVCTKLLEHTQNFKNFFNFCNNVLNKNGKLIIDVPDSSKSLLQGNPMLIWEEHISYFTRNSLINTLTFHKFKKEYLKIYNYKQEDVIVGIFVKSNNDSFHRVEKKNFFKIFKKKILAKKKITKKIFNDFKLQNKTIFLFGVGHNAIFFLNYFEIKKFINFVIDDNKNKIGLYIPFTKIIIKSSEYLEKIKNKKSICFLSLNIELEKKIINSKKKIFNKNCNFFSVYSDSPRYFLNK